jgi:hypothetical protein
MEVEDGELEWLLSLDGASYEAAEGYLVEFMARRTEQTPERPHGISYALVFRPKDGQPCGKYVKASAAYDHWHRTERDPGRPYTFTTAAQLLDDFWNEVRRAMNERNIPNDL